MLLSRSTPSVSVVMLGLAAVNDPSVRFNKVL